jgi:hypothetical protein
VTVESLPVCSHIKPLETLSLSLSLSPSPLSPLSPCISLPLVVPRPSPPPALMTCFTSSSVRSGSFARRRCSCPETGWRFCPWSALASSSSAAGDGREVLTWECSSSSSSALDFPDRWSQALLAYPVFVHACQLAPQELLTLACSLAPLPTPSSISRCVDLRGRVNGFALGPLRSTEPGSLFY